jgi:hypothetical protein
MSEGMGQPCQIVMSEGMGQPCQQFLTATEEVWRVDKGQNI